MLFWAHDNGAQESTVHVKVQPSWTAHDARDANLLHPCQLNPPACIMARKVNGRWTFHFTWGPALSIWNSSLSWASPDVMPAWGLERVRMLRTISSSPFVWLLHLPWGVPAWASLWQPLDYFDFLYQGRCNWVAEGATALPWWLRGNLHFLGSNRNHKNPSILFVGKTFAGNSSSTSLQRVTLRRVVRLSSGYFLPFFRNV